MRYYDQGPDNRAAVAVVLATLFVVAIVALVMLESYTRDRCIEAVKATGKPTIEALSVCDARLAK